MTEVHLSWEILTCDPLICTMNHPRLIVSNQIEEFISISIPRVKALKSRYTCTVKPVLSGHSKIDKERVLKTNGSLMKVESIAECSLGAFCNTFDLNKVIIGLENKFWSSF